MLYKNLKVKELYTSIPCTQTIDSLFRMGLEIDNDRLAVSAMEELILRGDTDIVRQRLQQAFERGNIKVKTTTATMIARSLTESCRDVDPILYRFGKFLFKAEGPDPFREFIEGKGKESPYEKFRKEYERKFGSPYEKLIKDIYEQLDEDHKREFDSVRKQLDEEAKRAFEAMHKIYKQFKNSEKVD